jgi:hypothetical protein
MSYSASPAVRDMFASNVNNTTNYYTILLYTSSEQSENYNTVNSILNTGIDGYTHIKTVIDSGASLHIFIYRHLFDEYKPCVVEIVVADGVVLYSEGVGRIGALYPVLYVPTLKFNLVSVSKLCSIGYNIQFSDSNVSAVAVNNNKLIYEIGYKQANGLYYANMNIIQLPVPVHVAAVTYDISMSEIWHNRLNHANDDRLHMIATIPLAHGFNYSIKRSQATRKFCDACALAKSTRTSPRSTLRTTHVIDPEDISSTQKDTITVDNTNTERVNIPAMLRSRTVLLTKFVMDLKYVAHPSLTKKKHALIITCYTSRYRWLYVMIHKNETVHKLKSFIADIKILKMKLKIYDNLMVFKSDNGGEFVGEESTQMLLDNLVAQELTSPHTPGQNGIAERSNRTIGEATVACMIAAKAPNHLWDYAMMNVLHVENLLPTEVFENKSTPYIQLYNKVPDISYLRVWGCTAYAILPESQRPSFGARAIKGRFIGYEQTSLAYLFYYPTNRTVYKTGHLTFNEDINTIMETEFSIPDLTAITDEYINADNQLILFDDNTETHANDVNNNANININNIIVPNTPATTTPTITQSTHTNVQPRRSTRLQNNTYRDGVNVTVQNALLAFEGGFYDYTIIDTLTDTNVHALTSSTTTSTNVPDLGGRVSTDPTDDEAMRSKDAELWKSAKRKQVEALCKLNTFKVVKQLPQGRKALNYKWVHKIKRDNSRKSRLTVKGCSQRPGEDFEDTFAPVARITLLRLFLSLAVQLKLHIRSYDVDSAFPNAPLDEEIYMKCPPELLEYLGIHEHFDFVQLLRALYGLKQASRQWYKTISSYLLELGFKMSSMDSCIFYYNTDDLTIFVLILLYVDDILIAAKRMQDIISFRDKLQQKFSIKESDTTDYLGQHITYDYDNGILTYDGTAKVALMLKKFGHLAEYTRDTPMDNRVKITKQEEGEQLCDQHLYRSIIGVLMYIAVTSRPDFLYAVSKCAQYMQAPTDRHMILLYDIIAYLRKYTDLKIIYRRHNDIETQNRIISYTDASHGDNDNRRSTGAYLIFFNGGLIAWSSFVQDEASGGGPSESEYKAIYRLAAENRFLSQMMNEFGIIQHSNNIPIMKCDNTAAIKFSHGNSSTSLLRHTDIKYRAVHEWIANKQLTLTYVDTDHQWADILTKPLERATFQRCLVQILTQS